MSENQQLCVCGKPFVGMCRIIALEQLTGNRRVFDTSKLTRDPWLNRQLVRDPANYIIEEELHGLK